ncbi:MAG: serine/threonine protein kinase [Phycisphaerae bacterium]|nr:serine/threonine protein kinase [Phycisphaerae bacterium]
MAPVPREETLESRTASAVEPLDAPGNLSDEALADLIDRDVADRLVQGLPVSLERYLPAIGDPSRRALSIDAAVDGALRVRVSAGESLASAVAHLANEHPALRRTIESTATISMLFGPSGAAIEATTPAVEHPLPARFGRALPDGRGRYELVKALGARRPARVFRAVDHLLSRADATVEVVVKILGRAGDQAQLDEAIEEARLLRQLRHESIVGLVDSGVSDDAEVYLVTEFVHGEPLREWVERRGTPSAANAARIIGTLAHAVGMVHRAGVIHCDLSPANILVDRDDRPRLVDFGSAVRAGSTAEPLRALQGTPGFMAPEQVDPGTAASRSLDVYALGALLFWMLTGASANGRDSAEIDLMLRRRADPRAWRAEALTKAGVPRGLARIVRSSIDVDPGRRPPDAAALARSLDAWLAELARSQLSAGERLAAWGRRRPRTALLLTIAATAIVTLSVMLLLLRDGRPPSRGVEYTLLAARTDRAVGYGMSRYDRSLRLEREQARALLGRIPAIFGTMPVPEAEMREWMSGAEAAQLASLLAGLQIISARHDESARIESLVLRTALATIMLAQGRDPTPILVGGGIDVEGILPDDDPLRSVAEGVRRAAAASAVAEGIRTGRARPGLPAAERALVELDASIRENEQARRGAITRLLREARDRLAAAMSGSSSPRAASGGSPGGAGAPSRR